MRSHTDEDDEADRDDVSRTTFWVGGAEGNVFAILKEISFGRGAAVQLRRCNETGAGDKKRSTQLKIPIKKKEQAIAQETRQSKY
jgi:hypothetical protein